MSTCRVYPAHTGQRARDAATRIAELAEAILVAQADVERAHDACWRVPLDSPDRADAMAHALAAHRVAEQRLARLHRAAASLILSIGGYS